MFLGPRKKPHTPLSSPTSICSFPYLSRCFPPYSPFKLARTTSIEETPARVDPQLQFALSGDSVSFVVFLVSITSFLAYGIHFFSIPMVMPHLISSPWWLPLSDLLLCEQSSQEVVFLTVQRAQVGCRRRLLSKFVGTVC